MRHGGAQPTSAEVVATTQNAYDRRDGPRAGYEVPPLSPDPDVYVLRLVGTFVCGPSCHGILTPDRPRGSVIRFSLVRETLNVHSFSLGADAADLSELGTVVELW
jgi:hypothetical protein